MSPDLENCRLQHAETDKQMYRDKRRQMIGK